MASISGVGLESDPTFEPEVAQISFEKLMSCFVVIGGPLRQALTERKDNRDKIGTINECCITTDIHNIQSDGYWSAAFEPRIKSLPVCRGQPNKFQTQFWPMRGEKFVPSEVNRFLSLPPQFVGGPPKSASKHGQEYREDSRDSFAMFVQKIDYSSGGKEERPGQGGAFLLLLGICCAVGLVSYWMARYQR